MTDTATVEAPASDADTDSTDTPTEASAPKVHRGRGGLEAEVKRICDEFVTGKFALPEGEVLTPHFIAKRIKEDEGTDEAPSTGAVAAALDRWAEIGFAEITEKPKAFVDYTEAGRDQGLTTLKAASAERKRAIRSAAKAAEKAASAPAPVASDDD